MADQPTPTRHRLTFDDGKQLEQATIAAHNGLVGAFVDPNADPTKAVEQYLKGMGNAFSDRGFGPASNDLLGDAVLYRLFGDRLEAFARELIGKGRKNVREVLRELSELESQIHGLVAGTALSTIPVENEARRLGDERDRVRMLGNYRTGQHYNRIRGE